MSYILLGIAALLVFAVALLRGIAEDLEGIRNILAIAHEDAIAQHFGDKED